MRWKLHGFNFENRFLPVSLSFGVQMSSWILSFLTSVNILVLLFCSIAGFIKGETAMFSVVLLGCVL